MPRKPIKTYTERQNMLRAIRLAGLQNVDYRVDEITEPAPRGRGTRLAFKPVFQCDLDEDVIELRGRGWEAERK